MCGCVGALHWGQVVTPTTVAFQLARRERVLERDIFRLGTATSVPLLVVGVRELGIGGQGDQRHTGETLIPDVGDCIS